jgi:hypothetical protein
MTVARRIALVFVAGSILAGLYAIGCGGGCIDSDDCDCICVPATSGTADGGTG